MIIVVFPLHCVAAQIALIRCIDSYKNKLFSSDKYIHHLVAIMAQPEETVTTQPKQVDAEPTRSSSSKSCCDLKSCCSCCSSIHKPSCSCTCKCLDKEKCLEGCAVCWSCVRLVCVCTACWLEIFK